MTNHVDELVSVAEAAKILRVSVPTVKRWLKGGRLPAYHLGPRYVRIRRSDLSQLLTPFDSEQSSLASEQREEPPDVPANRLLVPLTDDEVKQALEAMNAAKQLRDEMLARRDGRELVDSGPLIRAAREERSSRYE